MFNRTIRTLSAQFDRLINGTRSFARVANSNILGDSQSVTAAYPTPLPSTARSLCPSKPSTGARTRGERMRQAMSRRLRLIHAWLPIGLVRSDRLVLRRGPHRGSWESVALGQVVLLALACRGRRLGVAHDVRVPRHALAMSLAFARGS